MPGRFIGWGYPVAERPPHTHGGTDAPECTTCAAVKLVKPATLQLAICQSVHHVEWWDEKGNRRSGARDNACADCLRLATMLGDHLIDALTSTEGYAALEAGPAAVVALVMGRES